jgi:hypothetical protein
MASANQVELRSFQTRQYDNVDKKQLLRATVSTLQDLSFIVDDANYDFGTITATKLDGYMLKVSISLRDLGDKKTTS